MANSRKKCVLCGEWIEADDASVPYKGRYAHTNCFNAAIKALSKEQTKKIDEKTGNKNGNKKNKKPRTELKDAVTEEEYQNKKTYYQYLRTLISDEELPAKVYVLSENYIKNYGFSFLSMYQTLFYMKEYLGKEITGDVVGLIPYYHDEAKKYYESIKRVEEDLKEKSLDGMYKEKTVYIDTKRKRNRQQRQIDISLIGVEKNDV